MRLIKNSLFKPGKRKGEKVTGIISGKKVSFRKAKNLPKGCKTPKRICIVCLKTVISKKDINYDSKICKHCKYESFANNGITDKLPELAEKSETLL